MTARHITTPGTATPQRSLALHASAVTRQVPGVAYLSPGPRGGDVRLVRRHHDPAAGVTVTARATGWHIRIHLALYAGHRAATVADDVRRALTDALGTAVPPHPATASAQRRVTVGVIVTAIVP